MDGAMTQRYAELPTGKRAMAEMSCTPFERKPDSCMVCLDFWSAELRSRGAELKLETPT